MPSLSTTSKAKTISVTAVVVMRVTEVKAIICSRRRPLHPAKLGADLAEEDAQAVARGSASAQPACRRDAWGAPAASASAVAPRVQRGASSLGSSDVSLPCGAGAAGLEPATSGFGDRRSANSSYTPPVPLGSIVRGKGGEPAWAKSTGGPRRSVHPMPRCLIQGRRHPADAPPPLRRLPPPRPAPKPRR